MEQAEDKILEWQGNGIKSEEGGLNTKSCGVTKNGGTLK